MVTDCGLFLLGAHIAVRFSMKLHIKSIKTRKTFTIDVPQGVAAADVKSAIERQEDIPVSSQRLVFGGKPVREGVPLQELGIQKDATLHLVLRLKTYVELRVRVMSGLTFDFDSDPRAPVNEVVLSIQELLALDERPRVLCSDGRALRPAALLDQHGPLKDGSLVHLILVPEPGLPSLYAHLGVKPEADRARAYGLAGSLYARCGGIFGVAAFVDRCMDAWMADPTLNANDRVATWHQRAQRCGFKFLVTQLMGYLCGGPQVYTGLDMAASHKHLGISEEEWGSFIESLHDVCDELGLPKQEMDDVTAVIASMQADCTLGEGEEAPPNPGRAAPAGYSLYARCGGAYPLALFADRLVDALLGDPSVNIRLDGKDRSMPSLKYLFTELVCALAGGPETVTAPSLPAAKLSLSGQDFVKLLGCVPSAADHLESTKLASELAQMLHQDGMALVMERPPKWDAKLKVNVKGGSRQASATPTSHEGMRIALKRVGDEAGAPLLYVPAGSSGFLLALEEAAGASAKAQWRAATATLGFEEVDGLAGIAKLPSPTDKDVLFV